jgi:zinc/manganese transport system substrate-binding protein
MRIKLISLALLAAGAALPASAKQLNVFACEPEWGALAMEIGGDKVSVYTATTGSQDPHQVQARPSLIAKARTADVAVCTGAELEIAWLPMIAQQAGNAKIAAGGAGSFDATSAVRLLETPARLDRSQGDIHAGGNPHIQTDPRNMIPVSKAMAAKFAALDPANASTYTTRQVDFEKRWTASIAGWTAKAAPLKGVQVAVQHHSWPYLQNWLGMIEVTPLEPKPGVPPSSGYLAQVLQKLQTNPVKMVIRAAYEDGRPSDFIADKAKIPAVVLPFTIGGTDQAKDLTSLYDDTINRLLAGLK